MKDILLKLIFNIQKNCLNFMIVYYFYQKMLKLKKLKLKNLMLIYMKKKNEYVIRIRYSIQASNSGLVLKKSVYNH